MNLVKLFGIVLLLSGLHLHFHFTLAESLLIGIGTGILVDTGDKPYQLCPTGLTPNDHADKAK